MELRTRLFEVCDDILSSATDYEDKVKNLELFNITANNQGNNDLVVGMVKKSELKKLYSQHMVGLNKPARKVYDEIIYSAPNGKCPFCGFGQATTLDHYLPKSKFPLLSIMPSNIIPSCKDCNAGKSVTFALSKESQTLHPYYDHGCYITSQWLFATVQQTTPLSISYYVDPVLLWVSIYGNRVNAHFLSFNLHDRFAIEASNELAIIKDLLITHLNSLDRNGIKKHLKSMFLSEYSVNVNSWRTAMYQALMESTWYCDGGFGDY